MPGRRVPGGARVSRAGFGVSPVFLHFKSSCFERRTGGRAVRSTLILLFCEEVFSRSEPDWRIPESVYSENADPRS
ncbi:MAG: hypothetical protein DME40_02290 [Verrucomicrobia bacterium]|nr:MAG: hypothetical protein DME40_02290 [Verrucomicrobiota bacterium]